MFLGQKFGCWKQLKYIVKPRIQRTFSGAYWVFIGARRYHTGHRSTVWYRYRTVHVLYGTNPESRGSSRRRTPAPKQSCRIIYRCTITCAFCGKKKHYEDECYHKQRLSAKLKGEDPGKGSGKGGGKGKGNDSGKGKSKGRGQGQDKSQGGRGGGANRQLDKDNKNTDKNGGNPNPNPGGNSESTGGQSDPTTRSQTQAQKKQGAKREHEGGDDGNAKKRTRFMRMARKLRNKGFEVTCPVEF